MDHDQWSDAVFCLRDGQLSGEEKRAAEAHLASCALCREEQERWSRLAGGLFRPGPDPRAEFFVQKVMARLEEPERRWTFSWPRWLAVAAIPALAALMISVSPGGEPEPSTETLLLAQGQPGPSWAFSKDAPGTDEFLGWEEDQ